MENGFTKKIPSWFICDWFYAFFVINAIVFALVLIALLYIAMTFGSLLKGAFGVQYFNSILTLIVAGTNALFFYIICNRALLEAK